MNYVFFINESFRLSFSHSKILFLSLQSFVILNTKRRQRGSANTRSYSGTLRVYVFSIFIFSLVFTIRYRHDITGFYTNVLLFKYTKLYICLAFKSQYAVEMLLDFCQRTENIFF